ncbi:MAG: DNA recombination protein RmuC [Candidatus Vogelbacteria bacterium]
MSDSIIVFIIIAIAGVGVGIMIARVISQRKEEGSNGANDQSLLLIQNQLNELARTNAELSRVLDARLVESNKTVHQSLEKQFGETNKIVRDVTERLTKLDETNKQVISFTDQLQSLQDILKNPKQRGILGEYYLETLLKNVLPPGSYQMQYAFTDGTIVDAVVFVKDKIIPIDSKFSLENYNRLVGERDPAEKERLEKLFKQDLKGRIDETAKYVKPAERTMDFAFMFIPHEAIYYDLLVAQVGTIKLNTRDLIEYAFKEKHVIIVSPTSFLAYLQTVLQGLKALQIEESAKEIRKNIENLQKHLRSYEDYHDKLGNALATTVNHFNSSRKEFGKIDKDVIRITNVGSEIEPLILEKPYEKL